LIVLALKASVEIPSSNATTLMNALKHQTLAEKTPFVKTKLAHSSASVLRDLSPLRIQRRTPFDALLWSLVKQIMIVLEMPFAMHTNAVSVRNRTLETIVVILAKI
jgi:hypothetical protein